MLDNIEVDDESNSDIESARNFIELELEHYMKINNVSVREARRKSFVIRAIVFEATLLLERGDLDNTVESFDFIRYCIARELALI
jgi:tRNA(Ile)-lysidine synthase TilS/MesJ